MKSNPYDDLVTVIIPTYNRANRIAKAVESVLSQDYMNIELIVVDDGSTDETESVLAAYPTINLIRQANQGQGAARQTGLKSASGSYIASLDSDDFWNPDFVSQSIKILKQSGATFSFANWTTRTPDGLVIQEESLAQMIRKETGSIELLGTWAALDHVATREIFTRGCPAPSSSFLIDRASIGHGWRTIFNVTDDWAFLLDVIMNHPNSNCVFTLERLWTKQVDGTNIYDRHVDSVELPKKFIRDIEILLELHGQKLSHGEIKRLQNLMNDSRVDLAYAQSLTQGQRINAVGSAWKCLRVQPSRFTGLLLLKTLAKCLLDLRIA